jgi:hypothetical protein
LEEAEVLAELTVAIDEPDAELRAEKITEVIQVQTEKYAVALDIAKEAAVDPLKSP